MREAPRMIAGAPVKHRAQPIRVEQIGVGTWLEVYASGPDIIVCDLTSPLWQHGREPAKRFVREKAR